MTTFELIESDFKAIGRRCSYSIILLSILFSYTLRPLIYIRLALGGGKIIRAILLRRLKSKYHIELGCKEIGPYLRLPHPYGIIIAAHKIGANVMIGQYVTIGGNNCKEKIMDGKMVNTPIIGDNCQISAGSVVAGPIRIGDNVVIGANCTIAKDVQEGSLIYNSSGISTHSYIVPGWKGAFYQENEG